MGRRGGAAVTRESKLGLLVGLAFIVMFGVILSDRASSPAQGHAALPVGESDGLRALTRGADQGAAPAPADPALAVPAAGAAMATEQVAPPEEQVPAPANLAIDVPPPKVEDAGMLAFGPARSASESPPVAPPIVREEVPVKSPPVVAPPTMPPPEPAKPVHVVRAGESLTIIARQYYGAGGEKEWRRIYEANKKTIRNANRLCAGQRLVIPPGPTAPADPRPESPPPAGPPPKDPPREPVADTYFADAGKSAPPAPRDKAGLMAALRKITVPADAPRDSSRRDASRRLTTADVGKVMGDQSDLMDHPARPSATYTVRAGDTFLKIASRLYPGDPRAARLLAIKNQHLVADERKLKIGQRLLLLDGQPAGTDSTEVAVAKR